MRYTYSITRGMESERTPETKNENREGDPRKKTKKTKLKLKCEEEDKRETEEYDFIISMPDCSVSPFLKLSNGKNGHGERRLYTGDSKSNNEHICAKPLRIMYPSKYKSEIEALLEDDTIYAKPCVERKGMVYDGIDRCGNQLIWMSPQNGRKDVTRNYIGPNKERKENVKLYDKFRGTVIPTMYSLGLIEKEEEFECYVVKKDRIDTSQEKKKASDASIEWLTYLGNKNGIEIRHARNKGEFQLRNPKNGRFWPVDGCHICGEDKCSGDREAPCQYNNHIWEFQGDHWHGNPKKYDKDAMFHGIPYSEKQKKDEEKKKFYEEHRYVVNVKWESEWIEDKKEMKKRNEKWN